MSEIDVLKELYSALNRNDIPAAVKSFDPEIVRIEFEGSPMEGKFHGFDEVKRHFSQGRGTWAEGSCEPERFSTFEDKVIVFVYVRVKLKKNMEWVEGRPADVFTFKHGKITEMRTFANSEEALEWVKA